MIYFRNLPSKCPLLKIVHVCEKNIKFSLVSVRNESVEWCTIPRYTQIQIPRNRSPLRLHFLRGNKMPTRCNRGFYCKTCCPLNMFRTQFCPSSGVQVSYRWLLPMAHGALVYRSLVWCGAVGYASGLRDIVRTTSRNPDS